MRGRAAQYKHRSLILRLDGDYTVDNPGDSSI